jgi:hypothetical protein
MGGQKKQKGNRIHVVGEAADGDEFIQRCGGHHPQLQTEEQERSGGEP